MSSNRKTSATEEVATPVLVPRLRFPEFEGSGKWTTVKLGAVAKIRTEKVGDNVCVPMSITSGIGLVSQEEKFGRVIAGDSYKNYLLLKPNEFAYNKSATKDYPEGFLTLYSGTELAAVPNSIFTCFRINGDSPDVRFLNYQFSDNLHGRWLRKFIQVGARANGALSINDTDLMALPVPVPVGETSVAEQQKIADCLSSVDELIAAQARKVDAFKTYKKGLVQQLFPAHGESKPHLRLSGFLGKGEWQKKTVSSLLKRIVSPVRVETEGMYREIGIRSHGKGIFHKESVSGRVLGDKRVFWVEENTLVLSIVFAWEQAVAVTSLAEKGMIASHRFPMYQSYKNNSDVNFIKHFFLTEKGKELLGGASPGGAGRNKTLGQKNFENIEFLLPNDINEQIEIARCLSSVDDIIAFETKKLETLKAHKKGLMQQLFPSPEEAEA